MINKIYKYGDVLMTKPFYHKDKSVLVHANSLEILSITSEHIYALNNLPFHHKDPFDRLLITQSRLEGLKLASADGIFENYDVDLFWR